MDLNALTVLCDGLQRLKVEQIACVLNQFQIQNTGPPLLEDFTRTI